MSATPFWRNLIGDTLHLVARHVHVGRERLVFITQLVAGVAKDIRDATQAVGGSILPLIDARGDPLFYAAEHSRSAWRR
jgi:hypothetical protein